MCDNYVDSVIKKLKENGYKLTNQRKIILNTILEHKDQHLSCEEIYNYVSKNHPDVGIATVYRTVLLFENLKILYKLNFDDGVSRYEPNIDSGQHHHHHLICLGCNKVVEFKQDLLDNLEAEVEKVEHFKIVNHNLQFFGYCEECSRKKGNN